MWLVAKARPENEGVGHGGKETKKGNHGQEEQIAAEKKTRAQKQEKGKDEQFRGQRRAK